MQNRKLFLPLAAALPLAFTGCADHAALRQQEVARIAAEHERHVQEFEVARAKFRRENPMPLRFDLGDRGTLLVDEASLEGRPGTEHLWVRFTFVNTTPTPIESARVLLTLSDRTTDEEWSETMDLGLPFGFRFSTDSSYTSTFRMPLHGLYLAEDWSWSIDVTSVSAGLALPDGPGVGRRR